MRTVMSIRGESKDHTERKIEWFVKLNHLDEPVLCFTDSGSWNPTREWKYIAVTDDGTYHLFGGLQGTFVDRLYPAKST